MLSFQFLDHILGRPSKRRDATVLVGEGVSSNLVRVLEVEELALLEIQRGDRRRVNAALARNPRPVARRRELDHRDLAALGGGRAVGKREEVLILLGGMQLQDRVKTVQYAAKLGDIRVIDPFRFDVLE